MAERFSSRPMAEKDVVRKSPCAIFLFELISQTSHDGSYLRPPSSLRSNYGMPQLWFQMRMPTQHLPILVTSDERNLLNREAGLKEVARPFMSQVMEMKVLDAEFGTAMMKRRAI